MQRLGMCLLALVLAGCTGSSKPVAGHPTATPQESTAATPTTRVSSSPASLACRLPIVEYAQQAQGLVPTRGFLTVPGGQFTADPNGGFVQDGNNYHSSARPYLSGGGPGAGAYDWQLQRWLPVELRSVSPDGAHYAYQNGSGIHDVEVATGKDRTLAGSSGVDTVLYYAKEGVYFNHAGVGPPGPGLWLLDPATGKIQAVFTDKSV
ncbi:MAG: hypothetical protein M3077_15370, partial [Candidatus Dormibacteraeota bacterium]|nr:hypothetical protein [Candidatus Dormibacteraeota bacterium]